MLFKKILGEQAEVAMAVLPLLLQTKAGACRHKDLPSQSTPCTYNV